MPDRELEVGPLVASGRTAEVFAGTPGTVVKVLRPGWPEADAMHEARAGAAAHAAGVGAPAVLGTGRVAGRFAIVYERHDGRTMLDRLLAQPWMTGRLARAFAERHAAMHRSDGRVLPSLRDSLHAAVDRAADWTDRPTGDTAHRRIDALPEGSSICHGDYHPANVLLTATGPAVIDWVTAAAGPPEADIARTLFLVRDSPLPPDTPLAARLRIVGLRHAFAVAYGRAYRRLAPLDPVLVRAWRLPVLVARLSEDIVAERAWLLRSIAGEIARG